jgi:PHD/YefM family antitoxin component YafN of YafNO toxin-antitoxin module
MKMIIKPSSELRKNYNNIAEICRTEKQPVFLTRNGEGDTVLMDLDTYSRREEELALGFKLLEAEREWAKGARGYTVDELEVAIDLAIERGSQEAIQNGA